MPLLLGLCYSVVAQTIPDDVVAYNKHICIDDGNRYIIMTEEQIISLTDYGFDYDKYRQLRTKWNLSTISFYTGAVMIGVGGFLGRYEEHVTSSAALLITGSILGISGMFISSKAEKQISELVGNMRNNAQFGLTPSGVGFVYHF